jgi:KDO2-lipid IV(A) lauroyltransferase
LGPLRDLLDPAHPERVRSLYRLWRGLHAIGGGQRQRMADEYRRIFGDELTDAEHGRLLEDAYRVALRTSLEELSLGRLDQGTVSYLLQLRGRHHLDRALQRGKGVVILHAHAGSFMLPIAAFSLYGYRYTQFAARGLPPAELARDHPGQVSVNWWQQRAREARENNEDRLPAAFMSFETPTRELFRRLARNELVALAFDGRIGKRWVRTELLGRQALLTPGAYRLAASTGAAIVPTFCRTPRDEPSICELGEPLIPDGRPWQELMRTFVAEHGDPWLRRYPEEYGTYLAITRLRASIDDHPFFVDTAVDDRWKRWPALDQAR